MQNIHTISALRLQRQIYLAPTNESTDTLHLCAALFDCDEASEPHSIVTKLYSRAKAEDGVATVF